MFDNLLSTPCHLGNLLSIFCIRYFAGSIFCPAIFWHFNILPIIFCPWMFCFRYFTSINNLRWLPILPIWYFAINILPLDILHSILCPSICCSVDILPFDIMRFNILLFDILQLDILRFQNSAISVFCDFKILRFRYFATSIFCFRYYAILYFVPNPCHIP